MSNNFKNYANIYSTINSPNIANNNETVIFTNIENDDFTLNGSKIICNNAGSWTLTIEYQIYSYVNQQDFVKDILDTWLIINGKNVDNSNSTSTSTILSGSNTLVQSFCIELNINDYFECGIRSSSYDSNVNIGIKSFLDQSNIDSPSVIISVSKISSDGIYKNFANLFSTNNYPSKVNNNEYVSMTNIDTNDFTLDGNKIICNNPGIWSVLSQSQLYCYNNSTVGLNGQIDIFGSLNGIPYPVGDSSTSVTTKNEFNVLCFGGIVQLKKNDYLEIGIRSSSLDNNINAGIIGFTSSSGIYCPSFITSAYKISDIPIPIQFLPGQFYVNAANIFSLVTSPIKPNTNEIIPITISETLDFTINNTQIICNNPGTWFLSGQYQINSYVTNDIGINAQLDGWLLLNGVNIPNISSTCSVEKLGQTKTLLITYIINLNKGDYIEFGIRSNSLDNKLNVVIKSDIGPNGSLNPSFLLSVNKI